MNPVAPPRNSVCLIAALAVWIGAGFASLAAAQNPLPAPQDLVLKEIATTTGGPAGGQSVTSTLYISRAFMKRVTSDGIDTIISLDEGKFIIIDHKQKVFSAVTADELGSIVEKAGIEGQMDKQQMEAIKKMMGLMSDSITVTKSGPGEPVAGYNTQKYTVSGMINMEIWAAPELKVPAIYYDAMKLHMPRNPLFDMGKLYDEFKKVDGMTLRSVTMLKVMDMEIKTESMVTGVEKTTIPASTFDIPAGYRQVESSLLK